MKIAVVGAGAMGSIFGARFAAGRARDRARRRRAAARRHDQRRGRHRRARRGRDGHTHVPATTDPASVGPVDIVVFFTKCYHTAFGCRGRAAARRAGHRRRLAAERVGERRRARGRVPARAGRRRRHLQQRSRPRPRPGRAPGRAADDRRLVRRTAVHGAARLARGARVEQGSTTTSRRPYDRRSGRS